MKRLLRRSLLSISWAVVAMFLLTPVAWSSALDAPLKKVELPNKGWTFKSPDKPNQRILHPIKIGQAVNIRIHSYEVPVSAKAFIDQVRTKIMQKKGYEGAEIQLVKSKTVKGKTWDVFNIKRKDEVDQQIWARKPSSKVVLMVIYTGAGNYYQEYHKDLMTLIKRLS